MTEMAKTLVFLAAGIGSLLVAFVADRGDVSLDVDELVGERIHQFEVDSAKRLKIVTFENATASTRRFEVAEDQGLWTIPSKQGYPADATRKMAEAATCLIDREVLRVAANSATEHASLGVLDPTASNLDSKAQGVGIRVTITDTNDKTLADMIVGHEVKDAEGQRYVRNADQDVVLVIEIDPSKLSTDFEDWIEDDLLKLNPLDIQRLEIQDYSAELAYGITSDGRLVPRVNWDRRAQIELAYDDEQSEWQPLTITSFNPETGESELRELAEDEALDQDALRELRNGLDDLRIVDVERKPKGLSADLKAGDDFLSDRASAESLRNRGFAAVRTKEGGPMEILSSEGELVCTLKEGVEYVLRFGDLKVDSESSSTADPSADNPSEETRSADAGIHRYLFVSARFNDTMIAKPELDELPELPEGAESETEASPDKEEEKTDQATEQDAPEEPTTNNPKTEVTTDKGDDAKDDGDAEEAEEEKASEDEDALAKIIAERESIEKENQRRLSEYQDQIAEAKKSVAELNERFGDWYYVISNDVYKQIHLGLEQIVTKKEAEKENSDDQTSAPKQFNPLPGLPNLP